MLKNLRKQFWFISAFIKKYRHLIIIGLAASIALTFLVHFAQKLMPHKKNDLHLAIIGQYTTNKLPPIISNFLNLGLVQIDHDQSVNLNLAQKLDFDNQTNTYSFTLKPDLYWSNQQPVKTSDINLSIPNVQIETPQDNIIKFILPSKFAPFPSVLTVPLANQQGLLIYPYQIKLKQKSSGILTQIVISNSDQKTYVNIYPTNNQALTAYKLGQVDAIVGFSPSDNQDLNSYGLTQTQANQQKIVLIIINHQDTTLNDKNIRQALAYSLNSTTFNFQPALTTINPNSWAYNPLVKQYPSNPQRAEELLNQSLNAQDTLDLEIATSPDLLPIADKITSAINNQRITLHTKVVTNPPEEFQLYLTTFDIPQDPDQYTFWHSTQSTNLSNISNEKLDKLLEDGRTTLDQKERKTIYQEFQRVFAEELPAIVLYQPDHLNLARNQYYFDIINNYWTPFATTLK